MLDFFLGIFLALMAVRGWLRGLVREALDLVALVLGVVVAFRLSEPVGNFLVDRFGVSPEFGPLAAGVALFVLVGVLAGIAARLLSGVMRLPGLNLANRLGGMGLAVAWGSLLLILLINVLRALPLPAADQAVDDSIVAGALTHPEAPTQRLFQLVAGDRVLDSLLVLEPLLGERRVILEEDDRAEFAPPDPTSLEVALGEAQVLFDLINQERLEVSLSPLAWSDALAEVATAYAKEMYEGGFISHYSPETGRASDRVGAAGIRLAVVGENLALAATARAVHSGLMGSPGHRANILHPDYDRVGIGAVQGPYGLMVVELFGG